MSDLFQLMTEIVREQFETPEAKREREAEEAAYQLRMRRNEFDDEKRWFDERDDQAAQDEEDED